MNVSATLAGKAKSATCAMMNARLPTATVMAIVLTEVAIVFLDTRANTASMWTVWTRNALLMVTACPECACAARGGRVQIAPNQTLKRCTVCQTAPDMETLTCNCSSAFAMSAGLAQIALKVKHCH